MKMEKEMDTGDILLSSKEPIKPDDTAATLHDRLSLKGAALLIETLKAYADKKIKPIPQRGAMAKPSTIAPPCSLIQSK